MSHHFSYGVTTSSYEPPLLRKSWVGNSFIGFISESLVFAKKMSELVIRSKKRSICSSPHFWQATWAIRSHRSFLFFLVSDLSICSHCSLKKREWANRLFFFKLAKKHKNVPKNMILVKFLWANRSFLVSDLSDLLICSFIMSNLSNLLTVTHLSWAIWAIRSQSTICPERSERMSDERMSEFPTLRMSIHIS